MNEQKEISLKFTNKISGEKKLERYAQQLSIVKSAMQGINQGMIKDVEDSAKATSTMAKSTDEVGKKVNIAFNYTAMRTFGRALKNVVTTMTGLVTQSSSFLEDFNLFQVAFNGNYQSAERFVNKLSEMYGLDEGWLTRTTGIFKQLANAMDLSVETGERLSELMTQMSIDISSLYNVDVDRASQVLQSALAGQTKPIRGLTGGDITQATLQTTLDKLDIGGAVNQLSFAEKRLLIIISLTQQLEESAGDWGRTLESPANQLRILNEQWTRLGRAVGNLFLPILAEVLPYLNAILMVLTEIINSIATLLGFNLTDYDYFGSSAGSAWDFDDALQSAGSSAGKLKQKLSGLRSFDKLNVINTPSSSGGASGGGVGTGINPKLMEAFNNAFDNYQKKIDDVAMKATKIRDAIMKWLGFTKEIDLLTGKTVWKYQGIKTTLKNIWESFKKLNPVVKVFVGLITTLVALKIYDGIKKIFTLLKATKLGTLLSNYGSELKKMIEYVKVYSSIATDGQNGLMAGVDAWKNNATGAEKLTTAIGGVISAGLGLAVVANAMDDINESGMTLQNTLGLVGGSLSTIVGGISIGASVGGGTGALIGGITGGLAVLIDMMVNYQSESEKLVEATNKNYEAHKKYNDELREQKALIEQEASASLVQTTYHQNLLDELKRITDESGKVNDGYEARAKFIVTTLNEAYGTEMEIINGTIVGYQKEIQEVQKLIETKKANILLQANEKAYALAIENQATAWKNAEDSLKAVNELTSERNKLSEKLADLQKLVGTNDYRNFSYFDKKGTEYRGYNAYLALKRDIENYNKAIINQRKIYEDDARLYKEYAQDITKYEELSTAIIVGDKKRIEEAVKELTNVVKTENGNQKLSQKETLDFYKKNGDETIQYLKEQGVEITKEIEDYAYANYNTYKESLNDIVRETGEITDDIVEEWGEIGWKSTDKFMEKFKSLPDELTQREFLKKLYESGYIMSDELQKSLEKYNPTFKFDADLSRAYSAVNSFTANIGKIKYKVDTDSSGNVTVKKYAKGGLPAVGQMFIANERGPELVGNIGGQSFVANQNQMMDLLDKKIGNAQSKQGTQIYNIYLDENHKIGTYTLEQLQGMAKSNGKPITIG